MLKTISRLLLAVFFSQTVLIPSSEAITLSGSIQDYLLISEIAQLSRTRLKYQLTSGVSRKERLVHKSVISQQMESKIKFLSDSSVSLDEARSMFLSNLNQMTADYLNEVDSFVRDLSSTELNALYQSLSLDTRYQSLLQKASISATLGEKKTLFIEALQKEAREVIQKESLELSQLSKEEMLERLQEKSELFQTKYWEDYIPLVALIVIGGVITWLLYKHFKKNEDPNDTPETNCISQESLNIYTQNQQRYNNATGYWECFVAICEDLKITNKCTGEVTERSSCYQHPSVGVNLTCG